MRKLFRNLMHSPAAGHLAADAQPIHISYDNLAAQRYDSRERRPLATLDADSHIHGALRIEIGGRVLPHTGYFDDNDACFHEWIEYLDWVVDQLDGKAEASCLIDEGEQGQPAFLFERHGDLVELSIVEGESEGDRGEADPAWQNIPFRWSDFLIEYDHFKKAFLAEVAAAAPAVTDAWVAAYLGPRYAQH